MHDPTFTFLASALAVALLTIVVSGALRRASRRSVAVVDVSDFPADPPSLDSGRVPVWWCRPFDLVVAGGVMLVFASLALQAAVRSGASSAPETAGLLTSILLQGFLALMVTASVTSRIDLVTWLGLRWRGWPWIFLIGPASVVLMWVVFGVLQMSGYLEWMRSLGVETMQDSVRLLQKSDDPQVLGLLVFAALVVAPVCEEVLFRGHLHTVLKRYCGIWPAALASSLVFACAHGNLTAALPLFLFGLVLVMLYEKTGSLWLPVASHFLFNAATVAVQLAARNLGIDLPT